MQSTLGAALPISAQRFAGTAVGAAVGAVLGTYFPGNILVFGIAVLVIGIFCAAFRVERSAYRYASVTLAIVMLVARSNREWVIAVHRFLEVSIGIAVGLAITALWPERLTGASGGGLASERKGDTYQSCLTPPCIDTGEPKLNCGHHQLPAGLELRYTRERNQSSTHPLKK